MLKYVSGILKTISPAQRLIALCILILAIVVMTIGPRVVDSLTKDTEELKNKVAMQKSEIVDLSTRVNELNKQVLENQKECTNSLIAKEKEILEIVNDLEKHAFLTATPSKPKMAMRRARLIESDSSGTILESAPPPVQQTPSTNITMMQKIKRLKSKLQTDLKAH